MWFDNAVAWFNAHKAPLGGLVTFVAGLLTVLDKFYDLQILDVAIAVVGFVGISLLGAGMSNSDSYHKAKNAYENGELDDRRIDPQTKPLPPVDEILSKPRDGDPV